LAQWLLDHDYEVWGLVRRSSDASLWRIEHLLDRLHLQEGDLLDQGSLMQGLQEAKPHEVYNLAAQSFVGRSWREPVHTAEITGLGALRVLEAVRFACPEARVYQASTSEMYGNLGETPPTATGPFQPRSPYGTAKLFAHMSAINARESHGLFVANGILFNHESPRRGLEFVTQKICDGAARIAKAGSGSLGLGNLDARRDWGWAPDYVEAMWRMLQADEPLDLMVATGVSHSVRDLCRIAFGCVGLSWEDHVHVDPAFYRPAELHTLTGDPEPAAQAIGWRPKVSFEEMIRRMVAARVDAHS